MLGKITYAGHTEVSAVIVCEHKVHHIRKCFS